MLYRAWSRARRADVKLWESEREYGFDEARACSSAFKAAAGRAHAMEISVANGQQAAAVLWDLWKYFHTVPIGELVSRAQAQNYPLVDLALGVQMHRGCSSRRAIVPRAPASRGAYWRVVRKPYR